MAELVCEETTPNGNGSRPVIPSPGLAPVGADERRVLGGFIEEVNAYYQAIKTFHEQEPDEVLLQCSAYHARLTEIRGLLQRSSSARATQLRTREVDPLMHSIEKQFDIHSRLLTSRDLDFRMAGGQR